MAFCISLDSQPYFHCSSLSQLSLTFPLLSTLLERLHRFLQYHRRCPSSFFAVVHAWCNHIVLQICSGTNCCYSIFHLQRLPESIALSYEATARNKSLHHGKLPGRAQRSSSVGHRHTHSGCYSSYVMHPSAHLAPLQSQCWRCWPNALACHSQLYEFHQCSHLAERQHICILEWRSFLRH